MLPAPNAASSAYPTPRNSNEVARALEPPDFPKVRNEAFLSQGPRASSSWAYMEKLSQSSILLDDWAVCGMAWHRVSSSVDSGMLITCRNLSGDDDVDP